MHSKFYVITWIEKWKQIYNMYIYFRGTYEDLIIIFMLVPQHTKAIKQYEYKRETFTWIISLHWCSIWWRSMQFRYLLLPNTVPWSYWGLINVDSSLWIILDYLPVSLYVYSYLQAPSVFANILQWENAFFNLMRHTQRIFASNTSWYPREPRQSLFVQ